MGFKYLLFHICIHLFLVASIFHVLKLSSPNLFLALFSTAVIDIDHMPFIAKYGLAYWFKTSWESAKPRKYPLHNFKAIVLSFLGFFLIFHSGLFSLGICSLSITMHLLWDFFEDIVIFRMGIDHWK